MKTESYENEKQIEGDKNICHRCPVKDHGQIVARINDVGLNRLMSPWRKRRRIMMQCDARWKSIECRQSVSITAMMNRGWRLEMMHHITKDSHVCECVYAGMSGEYDRAVYILCKGTDL